MERMIFHSGFLKDDTLDWREFRICYVYQRNAQLNVAYY